MEQIINKAELCKILNITPKVAQKELSKALPIENSGVFKFGNSYRIFANKFFNYLENKDKVKQCDKENLKILQDEAKHTTLITMTKSQNKESVSQLARMLKM